MNLYKILYDYNNVKIIEKFTTELKEPVLKHIQKFGYYNYITIQEVITITKETIFIIDIENPNLKIGTLYNTLQSETIQLIREEKLNQVL